MQRGALSFFWTEGKWTPNATYHVFINKAILLWRKILRTLGLMAEDSEKIRRKLNELNQSPTGLPIISLNPEWKDVPGTFALTAVELKNNGSAVFIPSSGVPVKAFIHTKTGELKIFPAKFFQSDNQDS